MNPLIVRDPESLDWADSADVVVIGYGGAGASAALEARERGADVIVIDRFGGGGATQYSGGIIYAGGTRYQHEAGYDDDAAKLYAYLSMELGDAVEPETLRRFCEGSAGDIDWLAGHGVGFASDVYKGKITFPPEGKYLYYSGNEKHPRFASKTPPMPRGHRAVGPGYGGPHFFAALAKAAQRLGVRLRSHETATRLVIDQAGRVVGTEVLSLPAHLHARHQQLYEKVSPYVPFRNKAYEKLLGQLRDLEAKEARPLLIRARGGVVLATGGFTFNPEEIARHSPALARSYSLLHRLAMPGSDGSGIAMGVAAGGATGRMDSFLTNRVLAPPVAQVSGVLVNELGRRFVNEDAYIADIGRSIAAQPGTTAWLILSARQMHKVLREIPAGGWHTFKNYGAPALVNILLGGTRRSRSLDRLAKACKLDAAALAETVAEHDRILASGQPDALGKIDDCRAPLGSGPWYAVNMSMWNRYALTIFMTLGGLRVNEETGAVTRPDGSSIAGLYAAGMSAVGLHSNGYISGISLTDGVFSGRRAGRVAAETSKSESH